LKLIEDIEAREELERRARQLLSNADNLAARDDFQGAISLIQKADAPVASLEFVKQGLQKYQTARAQQEAREKAERERREREESIKKLFQEGLWLLQAGDETKAAAKVDAILKLDRQSVSGLDLKKKIDESRETREREEREKKERIARALNQAHEAQVNRQLGKARQLVTFVLKEEPAQPEALALLKLIEDIEAREELERRARQLLFNADILATRDDFQGAISLIQKADAAVASLEFVKQGLQSYQTARAQQEVREKAERERRERDESIKKLFQEGLSLLQAGDETKAAAKVDAILKLDRQSVSGLDLKKKIDERRETREREEREKKERIARALNQAHEAQVNRQFGKARQLVTSVLKEEPAQPEALALLKLIEDIEAREELERRARQLLSNADNLAARDDFLGAISLIQKADAAVASLEFVKQGLQKYQTARAQQEAREKAERERRERIAATLVEARKEQSAGQLEKALVLVRAVIAEDSGHKEALALQKIIEDAIETRKQRQQAKKRARVLLSQAEALASSGKYHEALSSLSEPLVSSLPAVRERIEEYQKLAQEQAEANERARRVRDHLETGAKLFSKEDFAGCEREMDQVLALETGHEYASDVRAQARAHREAQELANRIAGAIWSIEQNLKSGDLEAAREAVSRLRAIEPDNSEVARFQALIAQREDEIREQQLKKQRLQDLLADTKRALKGKDPDRADALLVEAVTLGAERSETAALQKRIDKLRSKLHREPSIWSRHAVFFSGISLVVLAAIGLSIWVSAMRRSAYQRQITSAQTYLQQNELDKAIAALQQVPADSRLYRQAQSLLADARAGQKKKKIDALIAEALAFRKAGQDDKSSDSIGKVLELDPSNQVAQSIRNDMQAEKLQKASEDERDVFVNEALSKAEELLKSGNLEGAKEETDKVTRIRPNDPAAANLNRRITIQLDASNRVNGERTRMEQAKSNAVAAKAPELAAANFLAARGIEQTALRQQSARQFVRAARSFSEATRLYATSEGDARKAAAAATASAAEATEAARQRALLRTQAENARGEYEQNHTKARDAGAEARGVAAYNIGRRSAADAETLFARGDFVGARTNFETASKQMQQAMLDAAQPPPPLPPPRTEPTQPNADVRAAQRAEAQRVQEDQAAIRAVLNSYKAAYETKSIAGMKSVFPSLSGKEEKAFAQQYKDTKTIQVQMSAPEIRFSGGTTAVATVEWHVSVIFKDDRQDMQSRMQFTLRKQTNAVWSIQRIDRN
jgi:methionine salvage enolase-phosphatase E1